MLGTRRGILCWHIKVDPFLCLLGYLELDGDLHLTSVDNFSIELSPASLIVIIIAHCLELCCILLQEQGCIQGEERLLPHLHDKVVGIQGILSLLGGIWSQHCQHGVDSDQLIEMRTVEEHWLALLLLTLLQSCCGLLGSLGMATPHTLASHGCLRDFGSPRLAGDGLLHRFSSRLLGVGS
jgi:hypothetical protein